MFATLSLLAAVTLNMQAVPQRPAPRRAPRAVTVPVPLTVDVPALVAPSAPELGAMAADLAEMSVESAPALAGLGAELQGLEGLQGLAGLEGLQGLAALAPEGGMTIYRERDLARIPRAPWDAQDPGDSLYRAGRQQLNRNRYADAARLFSDLISRYSRSTYTPDAYYWAAFALYKSGEDANLDQAVVLLDKQKTQYPRAATRGDSEALLSRVLGELARRGNQDAARRLHQIAGDTGTTASRQSTCSDDDDDPRIAAMNALLQMDAGNAVPIIKQVLAKRDACSAALRRKAVFVLSQKRTEETEDIMLSVARGDPDPEVRQQAVFWLGQVGSEKAITALDSIVTRSQDEEVIEKAIFALSQIHSPRAMQALRDFAGREEAPEDAREKAVFWLGQAHDPDNATFLRQLYGKLSNEDLKEKIIFSLSQMRSAENTRWLMDLALNQQEGIDLRKKALFWAGQTGADIGDLVQLYDRTSDQEMREQLIFVYSQRHEGPALDKMIDIARHETNRELRKKAIFWLGQSRDPRAAQALLEIINQ